MKLIKLKVSLITLTILSAFLLLKNYDRNKNAITKSHLGKKVSLEYFVSSSYESKRGHIFLNGRDFTAVIFEGAIPRFPTNSVKLYGNKRIRVDGFLQNYNGYPEIVVYSPKQIEIIK